MGMNEPDWWEWELELTPHVEKRMVQRGFTEIALREMLDNHHEIRPDIEPGRWLVETRYGYTSWEVIIEPDPASRSLVVITAYPAT